MDSTLTELIFEETRLAMTLPHYQDTVVAANPKHRTSSTQPCHRCGRTNHLVAQCKANYYSKGTGLSGLQALQINVAPIPSSTASCS